MGPVFLDHFPSVIKLFENEGPTSIVNNDIAGGSNERTFEQASTIGSFFGKYEYMDVRNFCLNKILNVGKVSLSSIFLII